MKPRGMTEKRSTWNSQGLKLIGVTKGRVDTFFNTYDRFKIGDGIVKDADNLLR